MARKLNLRVSDAECKLLLHSLVELRNALKAGIQISWMK